MCESIDHSFYFGVARVYRLAWRAKMIRKRLVCICHYTGAVTQRTVLLDAWKMLKRKIWNRMLSERPSSGMKFWRRNFPSNLFFTLIRKSLTHCIRTSFFSFGRNSIFNSQRFWVCFECYQMAIFGFIINRIDKSIERFSA